MGAFFLQQGGIRENQKQGSLKDIVIILNQAEYKGFGQSWFILVAVQWDMTFLFRFFFQNCVVIFW